MALQPMKLVTIIAERILEPRLTTLITNAGATGYTVTEARGWGKHGTRSGGSDSDANIMMSILTGEQVAGKIMNEIERDLIKNYGIMAYQQDAEVL
ncbi:MAG: P-II family nitrogen regulator [Nitrospiraceae bacterium]